MLKKAPWIPVAGLGVLALAALAALAGGDASSPPPRRLPAFELRESRGGTLSKRDLLGEIWVAQFIFTRCAGSCPVMVSRMAALAKRVPGARYVSFTVDPEHDTPEILARYAKNNSLPEDWLFATGSYDQMQSLAKEGFQLSMGPGVDPKEPIIHSDRFVLVDRYGRIRRTVSTGGEGALTSIEADLKALLWEAWLPVKHSPALNAGLNGACTLCLLLGLACIKAKRPGAHRGFMLAALGLSAAFLASYLTAHYYLGSTPYRGQGGMRTLYFAVLLSHTVLAVLIVPLAGLTVFRAFQGRFEKHRAVARWTLPLWLYVSVTGVLVYVMLYA
jgi:protein SCO1/2